VGRRKRPTYAPELSRPDPRLLELPPEQMRAMVDAAMERILEHHATLATQPLHATAGGRKLARALREPLPERGKSFERLLRLLFGRVIPTSLNTASPGYLAYVPGGGLFHAAVADLVADATNRFAGVWIAAPALAEIEGIVLRWFADMLGLPEAAGGILTTGGSLANFSAVVTARRERLPPDFLRGTLYVSRETHHSVAKAAMLAGFPAERVRAIGTDARYRIDLAALERAIAEDRAAGLSPFLLVGNAGSTPTGAVDDLAALADLAARERLWLHVDAAYGGFFALTDRGRAALAGVERADSVTLDPHKGLFLPYGTGALVVRDREALRRAHAVHAEYLPPMQADGDHVDPCELGPELSRDWRGLRVWLPLEMHGAAPFRAALDEKLDLARVAAEALRATPGLELVTEPTLSLFAFRARRPGLEGAALDALNRELLARVNARQRVFLTGTTLPIGFVLRVCVLSFRTHRASIDACVEDVRAALAELA
jgi:aromatic-L-amino-acid decarboxylase